MVAFSSTTIAAQDNTTLRWAVRTKGDSGFLFVNNYEIINTLAPKEMVRQATQLRLTSLLSVLRSCFVPVQRI